MNAIIVSLTAVCLDAPVGEIQIFAILLETLSDEFCCGVTSALVLLLHLQALTRSSNTRMRHLVQF
jgi:hypothetical protein